MEFGEFFERHFVSQRQDEERTIEQTLELGWEALRRLPAEELHRVTDEELNVYYHGDGS
jgi:V/A-type H+-transporting ATPase subunit B